MLKLHLSKRGYTIARNLRAQNIISNTRRKLSAILRNPVIGYTRNIAMNKMMTDNQIEAFFQRLAEANPQKAAPPPAKTDADLFRSLVGCLLSAQSKDENTLKAKTQLFKIADTPENILALDDQVIATAIRPCGLYNVKTRNLKNLCRAIISDCNGRVPTDRKGLMALPGIGRKCADIMLLFSFGNPVIAVDTHVHRVCNRTGLAHGKTEAATAQSLDERAPAWTKMDGHVWILEFGKKICRARSPKCENCLVQDLCQYPAKTLSTA